MRLYQLLVFCCILLAACSSSEETKPADSEPATLKHLQHDKRINPEDQAGELSVSLIPDPLISAQGAIATLSGCQGGETNISWTVNGTTISAATSVELSNRYFKRNDEVGLQVKCGEKRAEATARVGNSPPVITTVKIAAPHIVSGSDLQVIPEAEDVDGDSVNFDFHWSVNGDSLPELTGPVLPGKYIHRNDLIELMVIPSDQFEKGPSFEGFGFRVPNSPPKITSQPPQKFSSWTYEYQVIASDPDGDPLSYRLEQNPNGMNISAAGLLSWPLENVQPGAYTFEIVVEDPQGLRSRQSYTLNLSAPE